MGGVGRDWRRPTRCVCSTLLRRGKSLTPVSKIEMLEFSKLMLDCRDETQPASAAEGEAIAGGLM